MDLGQLKLAPQPCDEGVMFSNGYKIAMQQQQQDDFATAEVKGLISSCQARCVAALAASFSWTDPLQLATLFGIAYKTATISRKEQPHTEPLISPLYASSKTKVKTGGDVLPEA